MAGQALGSRNLPEYSSGQAGQAERVLHQYAPAQLNASTENVLIQPTAPGATFATDPAMRQAASQVAAALATTRSTRRTSSRRECRRTGTAPWSRSRSPATSRTSARR